jgi:glycosyltransferase involved in cell wall biosynthesis
MARKIVFYTHALVAGGAEKVMARLASGFAARGDEVIFAVDFDAPAWRPLLSGSVRYVVLPKGHLRATLGLAALLRKEKPDASASAVSVSNLKHAVAALLSGRARRASLGYHGFAESEREPLSRIGYAATPILSRLVGATVAVSQALGDELLRGHHAAPARLVVIPNPAAPEPFPAPVTAADIAGRSPGIVAVGRLAPGKDFATLLRAFARVTTPGATLTILGEGPERAALEGLRGRLGLAERVAMPGFVAQIGDTLNASRCAVVASSKESFGLTVVEALSRGLPVVSTDCGGPREILDAPGLGALVPVGDDAAMARSLDAALSDLGDPAARQKRAADFALDRALDGYGALFDRLKG